MAFYTDTLQTEVRIERLRPEQVDAARARRAAIYVPFGSLEWHGYHNPVGLDALKAHEQLVGLAARAGGLVHPPVYFSAGGGHLGWPHSVMYSPEPLAALVREMLRGFERDGFRQAILLSGHYPNRVEFLDNAAARYREGGGTMRVLAIVENEVPGVPGDHAALAETSFMLHLLPELVDPARLDRPPSGADPFPPDPAGPEEFRNWMRVPVTPDHPCWGLAGVDPRGRASAARGREATGTLLDFLANWIKQGEEG